MVGYLNRVGVSWRNKPSAFTPKTRKPKTNEAWLANGIFWPAGFGSVLMGAAIEGSGQPDTNLLISGSTARD
ncbi:hypothetical protein ZHAS_00011111 [Anopheles sinensis]|uniref:Uncharacterized protein n=1 Tax=Anopheles sinensis TaxID=74873 RepID=A0A084VZB9_ANOSI|nr:hypothetical protein ZHAS_00011111 [Anopheles sinensis]